MGMGEHFPALSEILDLHMGQFFIAYIFQIGQ